MRSFEVRSLEELDSADRRGGRAGRLRPVAQRSAGRAPRLRFIQSISAGTDQYDARLVPGTGVRLASGQGVNARAVAEHAMAPHPGDLTRQLHEARDNQAQEDWRGMIGDLAQREDELGGKTLLVVGMGRIGSASRRCWPRPSA